MASELIPYFWSLGVFRENSVQTITSQHKVSKLSNLPVQMPNPTCKTSLLYLPYLTVLGVTCGVPEMLRPWTEN